jgi:O-antigen/teichoic acid export membrane protein
MMEDNGINSDRSLTSGRRLIRNVVWNGAGEIGPLIAAFIATPILIHHIGTERFGILALAWTVFGYFSLFDLGMGSAMIRFASDLLGARREDEVPALFWTGLALMTAFGLLGASVFALVCPLLAHHILKIPLNLQHEALIAFYLLAIALPIGISVAGMTAMLTAYQRFDLITLVRSPNAIISSFGPLLVLPFTHNIAVIIAVLVVNLVATWIFYLACCAHALAGLLREVSLKPSLVRGLLSFGGWETGANFFGVIPDTIVRFMLAAMTSLGSVSFFVVPARILTKLHLIPALICSVLYPAFAHSLAEDGVRTRLLFGRGVKLILLALFPIVLVAVVFARELLTLWIGVSVANHSAVVLQLLALSVIADGIGMIAATLVSAAHRPDINAKIHAALLPAYIVFALFMIRKYGVTGAAAPCLARAAVDSVAHWVTARSVLSSDGGLTMRLGYFFVAAFSSMAIAVLPLGLESKCLAVAGVIAILYAAAWFVLLDDGDRRAFSIYFSTGLTRSPVAILGAVD